MEGEWGSSNSFNGNSHFMLSRQHLSSNSEIHEPPQFHSSTCYPTNYSRTISDSNSSTGQRNTVEITSDRIAEELQLTRPTLCDLYNQEILYILSQKNCHFSRMMYLRLSEPGDRDAEIIRRAMYDYRTDLILVMEIICTRSSLELLSIKQAYQAKYISFLEDDVSTKAKGSLKEILSAILNSKANTGEKFDTSMAMCDAKILYEAVTNCEFIDREAVISILSQRNNDQMKTILSSFKHLFGHDFIKFLKNYKCSEFGIQLRAVIQCIQFPENHFAKQLRVAMVTGDVKEVLIRTVVTRSGIDIKNIGSVFSVETGMSLASLIRSEFNYNGYESSLVLVCDALISLLRSC